MIDGLRYGDVRKALRLKAHRKRLRGLTNVPIPKRGYPWSLCRTVPRQTSIYRLTGLASYKPGDDSIVGVNLIIGRMLDHRRIFSKHL